VSGPANPLAKSSRFVSGYDFLLLRKNQEKKPQISSPRSPYFLFDLVALMKFVRLSLRRAASVVMVSAARQEIRLRSGRDDKGEGNASRENGCRT
jgi:hypothetical protein